MDDDQERPEGLIAFLMLLACSLIGAAGCLAASLTVGPLLFWVVGSYPEDFATGSYFLRWGGVGVLGGTAVAFLLLPAMFD